MSAAERDLLDALRRRLAEADVDVDALVAEAYDDARAEVATTLRRLIANDLLERCVEWLGGTAGPAGAPEPAPGPAPAPSEAPPSETGAGEQPQAAPPGAHPYVLGVAAAGLTPPAEVPPLPAAGPLRVVEVDGLAALVADVDPRAYEALRDPDEAAMALLADAARAHDAILAATGTQATVLPLPLGTVLTDEDALRWLLHRHAPRLTAELDRLAGTAEWAVTLHLMGAPEHGAGDADASRADSGRDYLQRQGEHLRARASRSETRRQVGDRVHARLAELAVEADTVASRPGERGLAPLLHGVYLLRGEDADALAAAVDELRAEWPSAVIEVSGPWPPYHFTRVRLTDDAGPA